MDYGPATFIASRLLNQSLLMFKSERSPGFAYTYHKRTVKYYACSFCKSLGKTRAVTVINNRIIGKKHPEDGHHPDCRPIPQVSIDAMEMDRQMRSDIISNGKRPREVYNDALSSIRKKFKSSAEQEELISQLKPFTAVRRSLQKRRTQGNVPVSDPFNIPDELRTTLRGKSVLEDDPRYKERFLMYSGREGKLQIFCADTELKIIRESDYIICDGTFEMAPTGFYQLYTVYGFHKGERMPLLWALLPDKTKETYMEMFGRLKQELGRLEDGRQHTFLTDFETAAIDSIQTIFIGSQVKGCTFHFRQALMRHVVDVGLRVEYYSGHPLFVKDWIQRIMGLTLLPTSLIPMAWESLKIPPSTGNTIIDGKMMSFSSYFERTWMTGSFPLSLWSHHDHNGPRTTNVAEGWHSFNNDVFELPPPDSRHFLNWLQRSQFEVQSKIIQLDAGLPVILRSATSQELDNKIFTTKLDFGLRAGSTFLTMFYNSNWFLNLLNEISLYLRYSSRLIGANENDMHLT